MQKILVIEDEEDLRNGLLINLKNEGYDAIGVARGDTGLQQVIAEQPDLVILDVMLPEMNGFDVCRELRRRGVDTPIIMLTARGEEVDKVVGLEIGADDYMTKPFSVRELIARIRARLRGQPANEEKSDQSHYVFGDLEIDFNQTHTTYKGEMVELSDKEYEILHLLIERRGTVVTRDALMDEVWGYDAYPSTRTVDNYILKLRKKFEDDPANPKYILSIYGRGYKFIGQPNFPSED